MKLKKININEIKPVFLIGKNGLKNELIDNIKKYLKKNRICKIKILNETLKNKKKEIAFQVAKLTDSKLIEMKGFTFVIQKVKEEK